VAQKSGRIDGKAGDTSEVLPGLVRGEPRIQKLSENRALGGLIRRGHSYSYGQNAET